MDRSTFEFSRQARDSGVFVDARAMKPEFDAPESARLHSVYGRRDANPAVQARYGPFNPANLFICQQRQREVLALLRKHGLHTLDGQDILDVGCGAGDVLVEFLGYGAAPACLHGVDLLSARLTKARARLPNSALSRADAQSLPYPDDTFSVVLQYTAFSSILDDEVRQNAASEMLRVMKPDGLILWYDFWLNPVNPETRGIKQKEVRHLFPSCRFDFHRTTLAPPVTRVLAKHSLLLCYLLERIPLMCTHYLVAITKRGAQVPKEPPRSVDMSILQRIRYLGQEPGRMNLFDRFAGLEPLLDKALGLTLLDIGMGEGHIAYEFVRRGARLVHGLDKHRGKVRFARRLFLDVPVPHEFWCTDLSKARGLNRGGLLEGQDLVLFLGVYHHLRMPQARLDALVNDLLDRTQKLFVVRTNQLPDFGHRIEDPGFILEYEHPRQEVGLLRVYRRAEAPA